MIVAIQTQSHDRAGKYWSRVPPLQANPLNSVVAFASVEAQTLYAKGYAVSGPDARVKNVSLTIVEGQTWVFAKIIYQEERWSWTLRGASVPLLGGNIEYRGKVYSRAADENGNLQSRDTV